jgi:hypothetical protein
MDINRCVYAVASCRRLLLFNIWCVVLLVKLPHRVYFWNTNKCTTLQYMYFLSYLGPTCFNIFTILREFMKRFH